MIRFDEEQKGSVRIALNASFLQRLVGTGYYYYDDIDVPPVEKFTISPLSSPESLSSSQQKDEEKPLIAAFNNSYHSSNIGLCRLWISLCTRLVKNETLYQNKNQIYLAIFMLLWLLVASTLLIILVKDDDTYDLPVLFLLLIPALLAVSTEWIFICLPEKHGVYFTKALVQCWKHQDVLVKEDQYFQEIQAIVDDLAPAFTKIGCTLDYVENHRSRYPFLAYIRMTIATSQQNEKTSEDASTISEDANDEAFVLVDDSVSASSTTTSSQSFSSEIDSSSSLSYQLRKFQWQAWEEHSQQVADYIQQQFRPKFAQNDPTLCGIRIQKVYPYRGVLFYTSIAMAFLWMCLNSGLLSSIPGSLHPW